MTPIRYPSAPHAGTALCSDLFAFAGVRVTMDMLPALRQRPGPGIGESLPTTFLRHADEQTVAALAAVLHAIQNSRMSVADFKDWGIVAAPCFIGRAALAVALQRLAAEGAWGISPHLIPHRSQHAVSGTISQLLKIFGPNFGAGGGPGGMVEALLAGSVLLDSNQLPGVWVVVTDWEPEAIPDANGCINPDAACHALALALVGARPAWQGVRLRVLPRTRGASHPTLPPSRGGEDRVRGPGGGQRIQKVSQLQALLTTLAQADLLLDKILWPLDSGGWIELCRNKAGTSGPRPEKAQRSAGRARLQIQQSGAGTEN